MILIPVLLLTMYGSLIGKVSRTFSCAFSIDDGQLGRFSFLFNNSNDVTTNLQCEISMCTVTYFFILFIFRLYWPHVWYKEDITRLRQVVFLEPCVNQTATCIAYVPTLEDLWVQSFPSPTFPSLPPSLPSSLLVFSSLPLFSPLPRPQLSGLLKLPQRLRAEPGRQTI